VIKCLVILKAIVVAIIICVRSWGLQCECVMWFILRKEYPDIMEAPRILEQEETMRFRLSQLHVLFLVFVQLLNGTT